MLDYGECSEPVPFDVEDEVRVINGANAASGAAWAGVEGALVDQNTASLRNERSNGVVRET